MKKIVIDSSVSTVIHTDKNESFLYFGGTNYLGLNSDPIIKKTLCSGIQKWGFGVSASRSTSGETSAYKNLENKISKSFTGSITSVIVPSTIIATLIEMDTLKNNYDFFIFDENCHPSIKSGIYTTGKPHFSYKSEDIDDARNVIRQAKKKYHAGVICSDSVNPIDGSIYPIVNLFEVAHEMDCKVLIDDSHGFGVLGNGNGVIEEFNLNIRNLAYIASFSKALGAIGGFLIDEFNDGAPHKSSSFFSTSTPFPPFIADAISTAIVIGIESSGKREKLFKLSKKLRYELKGLGLEFKDSKMPFTSFSIGSYKKNSELSEQLLKNGIWIPFIKYPSVNDDGVFRVTITAEHNEKQIFELISLLRNLL